MNSQNFNYLQRIILTSFFYTNFFSRKFLPLIYFFVNITQKIRLTQIKLCNGHPQITSDKNLDFLTPLSPFIQYCQNLSILPPLFRTCNVSYKLSLREKCPYSELLFWSAFSRIRTDRIILLQFELAQNHEQMILVKYKLFCYMKYSSVPDCKGR